MPTILYTCRHTQIHSCPLIKVMHTYIHIYTHARIYIHTRTHKHTHLKCKKLRTYTNLSHACIRTYIRTYIHLSIILMHTNVLT